MASLPPKIDQRTYEEIVRQIEAFAEDFTSQVQGGWKPPGAIRIDNKPELLSGLVLNENISIEVEATVAKLKGRILYNDLELSQKDIIKKGTVLNGEQARRIELEFADRKVKVVELLEATRNTLIDATLAQQISKIKGLQKVKVKGQKSGVIIENDAGQALIKIFARMVKTVSDRLNQVPEKNFLAFLDLIGGQLEPPQPAKVPLTFYLAEGSSTDALVPANTQVSAPPTEDEGEEIVFETDRELVVTTAQLKAVYIREPSQDKYSDRTKEATREEDAAFLAFSGDRSIEHSLYISCPEIFNLPKIENLDLIITGDTEKIEELQEELEWSYWNGSQWEQLTDKPIYKEEDTTDEEINEDNRFSFNFPELPIPTASEINNKTAKWLRAKLTNINSVPDADLPSISKIEGSTNVIQSGLIPEVCLFNNAPLDLSKDFYPFGEQPQFNDAFYIALHSAYIKPNVTITISIELNHEPVKTDNLKIDWEFGNGQEWEIAVNKKEDEEEDEKENKVNQTEDPTLDFTELKQEGTLKFPNKENENMPSLITINGEIGYWIRARIIQGSYGIPALERKYPVHQELAVLSKVGNKGSSVITVDSLDLFKVGDAIRLFPNTEGFPEEHKITEVDKAQKQLILDSAILNDKLTIGTRVMRKSIITETIPPTYNPPLVKSLKLEYKFNIEEKAIYFAENDFSFRESEAEAFVTQLQEKAPNKSKSLNLKSVAGLMAGDFLTINNEQYQIESINSATDRVVLTDHISEEYKSDIDLYRHFRPFTPTTDRESTLYLGCDRSSDNKTVTLFAQVEPPSPDELAIDITTETILTDEAKKEKILKLADITGWQTGDNIEIKNSSNEQKYDSYTISNIKVKDRQITLYQSLKKEYGKDTPVIYPQQPKLVWEYYSSAGWQTLGVQDETQAFSQRGLIQFIAPIDFCQREIFGQRLYWLRVRWQEGNFRVRPRLRRILTNTTWAVQATSLHDEILGSSNDEPNQAFFANESPILWGQILEVREGQIPLDLESDRINVIRDEVGKIESVWVLWQEVPDFYGSKPSDRHYILDRQMGEIRFGDGRAGKIPPRGRNNIRLSFYRTGGGKQGNVADRTIEQLKTTIPYIDRVINHEAAAGGAEQESLERLKERVPKQLRHRDRAVTLLDLKDLASAASTDVARVKVVTPDLMTANFSPLDKDFWLDPTKPNISLQDSLNEKLPNIDKPEDSFKKTMEDINNRAGQVKLIILPNSRDRQPVPSLALLKQVENYIRSRCPPTMDLVVTAPKWQEVKIETTIVPVSLENADLLKNRVKQALETFLHPLTGGKNRTGWEFGRHPQDSDFYAIIQSIAGVDWVASLKVVFVTSKKVFPSDRTESENIEIDTLSLDADTLIYSGSHVVNLKQ